MIDFGQLPRELRKWISLAYFIWAIGIAVFAMVLVIFSAFNIGEVSVNAETAILIGVAAVAPLMPFAQQLTFPGGTGLSLAPRQSELTETFRQGTQQSEIAIDSLPLEQMILGDTEV